MASLDIAIKREQLIKKLHKNKINTVDELIHKVRDWDFDLLMLLINRIGINR